MCPVLEGRGPRHPLPKQRKMALCGCSRLHEPANLGTKPQEAHVTHLLLFPLMLSGFQGIAIVCGCNSESGVLGTPVDVQGSGPRFPP